MEEREFVVGKGHDWIEERGTRDIDGPDVCTRVLWRKLSYDDVEGDPSSSSRSLSSCLSAISWNILAGTVYSISEDSAPIQWLYSLSPRCFFFLESASLLSTHAMCLWRTLTRTSASLPARGIACPRRWYPPKSRDPF